MLDPKAEPLVSLVGAGGGSVEGLRLTDGGLVLKVEYAGAVVQVGLPGSAPFPDGGGIVIQHRFGLRAEKTHRQIAEDVFGADAVAAKWHPDGWMRSQVRPGLVRDLPGGQDIAETAERRMCMRLGQIAKSAVWCRLGSSDGSAT